MNQPHSPIVVVTRLAFIVSMLLNPPRALSQESQRDSCWHKDPIVYESRSYCSLNNMPAHIRFFLTANNLTRTWDDAIAAVQYVAAETELDVAQAQNFFDKVLPLAVAMRKANQRALKEASCAPDREEMAPARAMQALNELEEVSEAVWRSYYAITKVRLSEIENAAMEALMLSGSASLTRTDFSKAYANDPDAAVRKLSALCGE